MSDSKCQPMENECQPTKNECQPTENECQSTKNECQHLWDNGTRTPGVLGGYIFTCLKCKEQHAGYRSHIPSNRPDTKERKSKKQRRKEKKNA